MQTRKHQFESLHFKFVVRGEKNNTEAASENTLEFKSVNDRTMRHPSTPNEKSQVLMRGTGKICRNATLGLKTLETRYLDNVGDVDEPAVGEFGRREGRHVQRLVVPVV